MRQPLTCEALCCRRNRSHLYTSDTRRQKQAYNQRSSLKECNCLHNHCKHSWHTSNKENMRSQHWLYFSIPLRQWNCYLYTNCYNGNKAENESHSKILKPIYNAKWWIAYHFDKVHINNIMCMQRNFRTNSTGIIIQKEVGMSYCNACSWTNSKLLLRTKF